MRFVLDSNLYVEAIRDASKAAALGEFTVGSLANVVLHAVVVQGLLAGAVSASARREVYRDLILLAGADHR